MNREALLELVRGSGWADSDTLLADGFEGAFIGIGFQFTTPLAVYDFEKCVEILMQRDAMDYAQAIEWMEYNVVGAYMGKFTPLFLHRSEQATVGNADEV